MKTVTITTDGACRPNPGPGGWAAVLRYGQSYREIVGREDCTTNNRAELRAVIEALQALKEPCSVLIRTDSMYSIHAIRRRGSGKKIKANHDLVARLHAAMDKHRVSAVHVRGHAGDPDNERCDELAEHEARRSCHQ